MSEIDKQMLVLMRAIAAVLLLAVVSVELFAQSSGNTRFFPTGTVIAAIQLDSTGSVFVAGTVPPGNAFVAKLSPDGSQILYWTLLSGNGVTQAHALALGRDGSAYVTGETTSTNFPVTPGSFQPPISSGTPAFVTKLDSTGAVQYGVLIGSPAYASGRFIAVGQSGEAVVGIGGYPLSLPPGPGPFGSVSYSAGFLLKLDAAGTKAIFLISAPGYGPIALDSQGNIYLAGASGNLGGQVPTTSGAFQASGGFNYCGDSGGLMPGVINICPQQYIAKISQDGSALLYSTYVTGRSGAQPTAIAVDTSGNVYVAGTTSSSNYPVTNGSFQTVDLADAALPRPSPGNTLQPGAYPPPATGYVTKLNSQGTALLWSTFFGGTWLDVISSMRVSADGGIYLVGISTSGDLPGTAAVADGCRPSPLHPMPFVTQLSSDGTSIGRTRLTHELPSIQYSDLLNSLLVYFTFPGGLPALAVGPDGTIAAAWGDTLLAGFDLTASPRACILDSADYASATRVAPGELVSIFGASLKSQSAVMFNRIAAPVLYASPQTSNPDGSYGIAQLNVQVPYEIAGESTVSVQIGTEIHTLLVATLAPSAFLIPGASTVCEPAATFGWFGSVPLARNADGSVNSCSNPAQPGSTVTISLNGLGVTSPALPTGSINSQTPIPLNLTVSDPSVKVVSAVAAPGQPSGVWQVGFAVPNPGGPGPLVAVYPLTLQPKVSGVPLLEPQLVIWALDQ